MPDAVIAAWGSDHGDALFAQLMVEGTFSLAMVEAYTYCPECGDWPKTAACCSNVGTERIDPYFPRLDWARRHGYLNRTLFCFGWMLARSDVNPRGWTKAALWAAMVRLEG
jgi:hypothetical protein